MNENYNGSNDPKAEDNGVSEPAPAENSAKTNESHEYTESTAYTGNENRIHTENERGDYVPPHRPETYVASESGSWGGFSQKWAYDKAEGKSVKKGNGIKYLAVTMTALFVITALVFLVYALNNKYEFLDFSGKSSKVEKDDGYHAISSGDDGDSSGDRQTNADIDTDVYKAAERIPDGVSDEYTGEVLSRQSIIKFASKSVVGIKTQVQSYSYFGSSVYEGVGSGFIITESGYIVTNYHVIEDASAIKVILSNGNEYDAELVGGDELSDVAVLRIDPKEQLNIAVIGDSDIVMAGDDVVAIGCPAGIEFAGTATSGMVSMANRELSVTDSYGRVEKTMYVIQIDAAINPGNSGGPLLNDRGEVIGINTLKLSSSSYEGIGFALPINGVMDIVYQICENGEVVSRPETSYVKGKAVLGISYDDISEQEAEYYQVPQGVLVMMATPGGAAQKYGIKSGDIITSFNSVEVTDSTALMNAIAKCNPGDTVKVCVWRSGETLEFDVTLGESSN